LELLAFVDSQCVRVQRTLGDREEQSVVQAVAQNVSQERQTPAAGAGAHGNLIHSIGTAHVAHCIEYSGKERVRKRRCARTS
jgi:ribosomal protein L9